MKKYLITTISLTLLLFIPTYAQEIATRNLPIRLATISETNYLNQLALKGFNLETQGLLIESLDGRTVYADLNSSIGFNPASVIKVATSFAALAKFGPDFHRQTLDQTPPRFSTCTKRFGESDAGIRVSQAENHAVHGRTQHRRWRDG